MTVRGAMGLPVVGMVGGGQLSRMTHQASIALGLSLRVLADAEHDSAALVAHGVEHRRAHLAGRPAGLRRRAARSSPSTTSTCPSGLLEALEAEGFTHRARARRAAARAGQARHARAPGRARRARCRRSARWRRVADVEGFARHVGWPLVLKAATGGYDGKGVWVVARPRRGRRGAGAAASGCSPRSSSRCSASSPRSSPARRTGRAPPGRSSRPCSPTASASRSSRPRPGCRRSARSRRRGSRCGSPTSSASSACSPSSCSRPPTGIMVNELAMRPHNSAPLDDRGRAHLAVRAAPAGGARLPARRDVADRAAGRDGQRARRRRARPRPATGGCTCSGAATPALKVHLYGKQVRPGRKIGHVTVLGDDLDDVRRRAQVGAAYLRDGTWPDDWPHM